MENKYLILGQGIAGTVLSMRMEEASLKHTVVNDPSMSSCSRIAAGLINPVVLKRLKKVENADRYRSAALKFYRSWEEKLDSTFLDELPIHHIFQSVAGQNDWIHKSDNPALEADLGQIINKPENCIDAPYGIGIMNTTSRLNMLQLIESYRQYLIKAGNYHELKVQPSELEPFAKNIGANRIVLANGQLLRKFLPPTSSFFSPTRGELLTIESNDLPENSILHSGVFILPMGTKKFRIGATYAWDNLNDQPTENGREELESKLQKIFKGTYKVIEHHAGVRPNTRDRKPLLGQFRDYYIFNGLGSRGALMAPYLGELMTNFLRQEAPIPEEYNIQRFMTSNSRSIPVTPNLN